MTNAVYTPITACTWCGSITKTVIFSLGDHQRLVRCKKCHLGYLDYQRTDITKLYNSDYYKSNDSSTVANYCDYSIQEKIIKNKFKFAYSYIRSTFTTKSTLLEIGPGYGYFLKYLPKRIAFSAAEVSKIACTNIKKNSYDVTLYNQDFMDIRTVKKYDYIVSFDVIEHQVHMRKFIKKISALTKKGGVFIFTTPDYGTILNAIFGKHAPTVQPLYHNYYFDKPWLLKNLPTCGFKILYMKTTYFEPISIGTIVLYGTFAIPLLKKIHIQSLIRFFNLENIIVPFMRFGGIECIIQKI